jgi:fibronectin-binding autotransporter adhesin
MTPNSVYRTLVAKRHIVTGMLALACALMASTPAGAQTITTWTGGAGTTSWNNASNWSNGSPSNTAGSTTTINLPNASVTTPANVSIRSLTVSGSLGAGQTAPTLTISNNFTVAYTAMNVGSVSSGSNFQGIVNHTSGTVSITLGAGASRLNIANSAGVSTSNNRGEYNLNGSQSAPAALVVDSTVFIGARPGETGLLSLDGYGSLSAGSLNLGNFNGAAELRVRGGNLAVNVGSFSMSQSGGGSSTLAATLTNSGSTGFSTINTTGAVQFGNGSLNPTTFTLALDGWVSSGVGQVVTILSSGSTFTGAGVFGNLANGATLTRASGTATGSPSYTFTAGYGLDNADSRTKLNLTVSSADLTWNNGSSDGMWSTGTANAGFTGTRWLPGANATFGATGAGAVTVSGTQSVRNLTVSSAGYSFSGGSLSPVSSGTWSIANDTTIASTLTGTGGLVKAGVGSLVLTGTSDYSGNTTISAGTLRISGAGQLGGGSYAGVISNSGTLAFASAANQTLSGAITGAGALAKSAAGSLSLTNTASFTGGLTVSAGTLAISGGVAGAGLTISGSDAATATLNVASNLSSTNNTGFIVGSNSQSLNGWRGIVNQTSGTVSISGGASAQLWVGAIAASNGGSTSNSSGEYYLSGLQSAPSRLAVEREIYVGSRSGETGLLSLSGYGTVSGTSLTMGQFNGAAELRVRGGNLAVNIGGGLIMSPFGGGNSTIAATLTDSGSTGFSTITTAGAIQFGNSGGTLNPTTFTLALDGWVSSGVGQVVTVLSSGSTFTGAGRFNNVTNGATLTGTSGTAAGSPNYTFTAGYGLDNADSRTKFNLTVASANLTWNNGSADGVWSTGTANAGFTGSRWVPEANVTFGATGAGAVTVSGTQSVRNLTVSSAGYSFTGGGLSLVTTGTWSIANATTIASALSGTGGFTKIGAGTLTLTGSSTYSGPTQINAGRMLVNGLLGSTAVTVNSGGLLGGSGSILGGVTIAGGSLSPGNSPGELSLASLALSGSSTTLMEIDGLIAGTQYDRISLTDSLTYGGTLQLNLSQTFENGTTFGLFSGFSSFSGNLASIVSTGSAYAGATFTRIGNVWTSGTVGSQTLELNQATGTLVIVPEPAGLILVAVAVATGALARRCRHARHH